MKYEPKQGTRCKESEQCENNLACTATQFHTEGETLVLHKMKPAPVANQGDVLADLHVCLNPYLDYLVDDQNGTEKVPHESILFSCFFVHDYAITWVGEKYCLGCEIFSSTGL